MNNADPIRATLASHEAGKALTENQIELLIRYYELVMKWNGAVHLTTMTDPAEFAAFNLLETAVACTLLKDSVRRIWDLGSGMGVPGIPMAIIRSDVQVELVEANRKKSIFLIEAVDSLKLGNVKARWTRFEDLPGAEAGDCVTSRAIEGFPKLLPGIMKFAKQADQVMFFGNSELAMELSTWGEVHSKAFPENSGRLILFHVER